MSTEDWSVRDDALRMYRENDLTPEQVAERLGVDADSVREWIHKNGRLKQIHRPQNWQKLRARRMEVLRLSANNHDDGYIAHVMGLSDRTNIGRLRARALESLAAELRDEKAWDKAKAMHIAYLASLLAEWMPRSKKGDEEAPKYGDLTLKALAQIAQVSGFNTIHVHNTGDTGSKSPLDITEDNIRSVLSSLDILHDRVSPPTIDGEIAGTAPQPGSDLPGKDGLPA